uniref:Histone H1 (Fragments) n=1 Tax=Paracentrotus lividus TaxID=7656 RepID=Q7M408_PARLI
PGSPQKRAASPRKSNVLAPHVRRALRNGVASGALKQVTGTGASGRFRV